MNTPELENILKDPDYTLEVIRLDDQYQADLLESIIARRPVVKSTGMGKTIGEAISDLERQL